MSYCCLQSWSLQKAQSFKTPLRPILLKGLKFIQRSDVNDVLLYFELLDEADLKELRDDDQEEEEDLMKLVMVCEVCTVQPLYNGHLGTCYFCPIS